MQKNNTFNINELNTSSIAKPLLITTGEPAGIGMDVVLDFLARHPCENALITACAVSLQARAEQLYNQGALVSVPRIQRVDLAALMAGTWQAPEQRDKDDWALQVIDTPCAVPVVAGLLNSANASMVAAQLDIAHRLASGWQVTGIVTAPIQKSVMITAGICLSDGSAFSGHTEYFMQRAGLDKVVMMLANQVMKVALVTTHLPLKDVPAAITKTALVRTIDIVYQSLKAQFGLVSPRLLVCGLNPHAGEDGHLGTEERDIINPVLRNYQEKGMDISLALPADTLFTSAYLERCDAVIAMYHDQGLAPLKSHGFGDTVNITLGLPYVRTSVDHGTALTLAGTGQARASSLAHAYRLAAEMSIKAR